MFGHLKQIYPLINFALGVQTLKTSLSNEQRISAQEDPWGRCCMHSRTLDVMLPTAYGTSNHVRLARQNP